MDSNSWRCVTGLLWRGASWCFWNRVFNVAELPFQVVGWFHGGWDIFFVIPPRLEVHVVKEGRNLLVGIEQVEIVAAALQTTIVPVGREGVMTLLSALFALEF